MKRSFPLHLALMTLLVLSQVANAEDCPANAPAVYCTVKQYEDAFEVPRPVGDIFVGTFNAGTGGFNGLRSSATSGTPRARFPEPVNAIVNAVDVRLKFNITYVRGPVSLTVNGKTYSRSNPGPLYADISDASAAHWTLRSGRKQISGILMIQRPPVIGVGAFTLPVLPLAILYEPPQDNQKQNKARLEKTHVVATEFSMEFSDTSSTTKPAKATFSGLAKVKSLLGAYKSAFAAAGEKAEKSPDPAAQTAGAVLGKTSDALGFIITGLGENTATQTEGSLNIKEESIVFKAAETIALETTKHKGPGFGDRFLVLLNARFLWVVTNNKIQLTMLDYEAKTAVSADDLRSHRAGGWLGLDTAAINSLLSVSPTTASVATSPVLSGRQVSFADRQKQRLVTPKSIDYGASHSPFENDRFLHLETLFVLGEPIGFTSERDTKKETTKSASTFSLRTENFKKGWLSHIGIAVPDETKTVKANTTYTQSAHRSVSDSVKSSVDLYAEDGEEYGIDIFLDQAFNTLAFERYELGSSVRVTGTAHDQGGGPLANEEVVAVVDGRRYRTVADKDGNYTMALNPAHLGTVKLTAGTAQGSVQFKGTAVANVQLRPVAAVMMPTKQNSVLKAVTPTSKEPLASEESKASQVRKKNKRVWRKASKPPKPPKQP